MTRDAIVSARLRAERDALKARVAELEAAVERYADPEMWQSLDPRGCGYRTDFLGIVDETHKDGGSIARAALAGQEGRTPSNG